MYVFNLFLGVIPILCIRFGGKRDFKVLCSGGQVRFGNSEISSVHVDGLVVRVCFLSGVRVGFVFKPCHVVALQLVVNGAVLLCGFVSTLYARSRTHFVKHTVV